MTTVPDGYPRQETSGLVAWARGHPVLVDTAMAVALGAITLGIDLATDATGSQRESDTLAAVLILVGAGVVALRRVLPAAALAVSLAATIPYWVLDYPGELTGIAVLVTLYSNAAHTRSRSGAMLLSAACLVAVTVVVAAGVLAPEEDLSVAEMVGVIVQFAVAAVLGDAIRNRRAYVAEIESRVAGADQERRAEAVRAVAEERTRIARELHDVVAHSMSVMVLQAQVAKRMIDRDTDKACDALDSIETTGRESLADMRRILGVLRAEGDAPLAPQPRLGDFASLVRHCEEAGVGVEIVVDGAARTLPPGTELAAYRIVQEALTNTVKHAGPATATVQLSYRDAELDIAVTDDGRGAAADGSGNGAGLGIVGMRERVEMFGGSFDAGPRPGGGYRVHARLPLGST